MQVAVMAQLRAGNRSAAQLAKAREQQLGVHQQILH
jgi:hypothetical protein